MLRRSFTFMGQKSAFFLPAVLLLCLLADCSLMRVFVAKSIDNVQSAAWKAIATSLRRFSRARDASRALFFQTYRIVGMQIADVWRSISMSKWLQEDLRHRAERQAVSFEILILQENALKKSKFS